ncbi:galectin-3-binding protein-like [Mizuhopecten yessoensis]|uniref:galectin-3-binding protein-like n=1 Tax=Mizuhopecten yessoensis TaxID=6573 RepID=UPI000B45743C|nr:galectin-3-binding protein-like [Mizuhopecten yessoensis]
MSAAAGRGVAVPVRLADSPRDGEGRVELFHDGVWGTVCDVLFGVAEAKLVCEVLGYSYGGLLQPKMTYGFGRGPIMVDLDCPWDATNLGQCSQTGWSQNPPSVCNHDADVGVACRTSPSEGL